MYTYEIFPLHLPGMNYRIHSTIFFPQVYIETEKNWKHLNPFWKFYNNKQGNLMFRE